MSRSAFLVGAAVVILLMTRRRTVDDLVAEEQRLYEQQMALYKSGNVTAGIDILHRRAGLNAEIQRAKGNMR